MLEKMKKVLVIILVSMAFSACSSGGPVGILYTGVTNAVSGNGAIGQKTGEACAKGILGLFAFGNAGVIEAANNGGIKTIATIDHRFTAFFYYAYIASCTIVTGN